MLQRDADEGIGDIFEDESPDKPEGIPGAEAPDVPGETRKVEHNPVMFLTAPGEAIRERKSDVRSDAQAMVSGAIDADEYRSRRDARVVNILTTGMGQVYEKWSNWKPVGFGEKVSA